MIAVALILASLLPVHSTPCGEYGQSGPNVGRVVHLGASADLSPVGVGACTRSAWVERGGEDWERRW